MAASAPAAVGAAGTGPELGREIGLEPLGSLQKDSGTRAEPLLLLKAKLSGCCEGAVAPAGETPLRGRERGQLVRGGRRHSLLPERGSAVLVEP